MAFGTATNTYTMSGVASAASTAAQSGTTEFVTTDLSGNLAAVDLGPSFSALNGRINSLSSDIRSTRREARAGTALAIATANIRYDDRPGKFSIGTAFGGFVNEEGGALGVGYTSPNERVRVNLSGGGTSRGDVGVGAGIGFTLN
jgi:hypothetical protein